MSVSMANPTLKPASIDPETSRIKVPPHSVEAEQAVLGGLMLDNEAWDRISWVDNTGKGVRFVVDGVNLIHRRT